MTYANMINKTQKIGLMLAVMAGANLAHAQDDASLYAPAPDPNAGYIRTVSADRIDGYQAHDAGMITVTLDNEDLQIPLEPGMYVTLARDAQNVVLISDDVLSFSPSKADLTFYNLSDADAVDVFVPRAKANAIAAIDAGGYGSQALRAPLTIDIELRAGDQVLAAVSAVELRRGEGASIVLTGSNGEYAAHAANNTYRTK